MDINRNTRKWRPVRDVMLVKISQRPHPHCPVRDKISSLDIAYLRYAVLRWTSAFYQHFVPNGTEGTEPHGEKLHVFMPSCLRVEKKHEVQKSDYFKCLI